MNIRLAENDFELEFRPDDEEFNENYQKYCIIIKDNDDKSAEYIQQQILNNQAIVDKVKEFWTALTIVDGHITDRLAYDDLRKILYNTVHSIGSGDKKNAL